MEESQVIIINLDQMEFDQNKKSTELHKDIKSYENTLSCSHSNVQTLKQHPSRLSESSRKQNPFKVIRNFRQTQEINHPIIKGNKNARGKAKRKLSEYEKQQGVNAIKKPRKMTENIEVQGILQEEYQDIYQRHVFSEAPMEQYFEDELKFQGEEIWGNPELEMMIPMEINQSLLDLESPLQLSSFRNITSFQDTGIKKR